MRGVLQIMVMILLLESVVDGAVVKTGTRAFLLRCFFLFTRRGEKAIYSINYLVCFEGMTDTIYF